MRFKQFIEKQFRYNFYFYQRLRAIQVQETWDKPRLLEHQNRKFLALINKAYQYSPFYRAFYDQHGVDIQQIKSVEDIHALPHITKTDVRDNMEGIFIGKKFNRVSAYTSGTSGNPTQVYRDYQSIIEEGAYQWAHRIKFGHTPGMKTLILRGNLHRDQKERYNPFTKTLELSSYHLSASNAQWYFDKISEFAPNAVLAYPSSIESLANLFTSINKSLEIPLIFTSSETLYGHQRTKIEHVFNARIADWYGNAERTIALQERRDYLYEELPLYSANIFGDGYVLSTGLINTSFPLINYQVDDHIRLHSVHHEEANVRLINCIQGRSDDVLILPDGTRIGLLWGAFDRVPHLLLAQIVQTSMERFEVNIVVTDEFSREDEAFLERKLKEFVGEHAPFTIHKVDEKSIIKTKAGKFKLVINHMLKKASHEEQIVRL